MPKLSEFPLTVVEKRYVCGVGYNYGKGASQAGSPFSSSSSSPPSPPSSWPRSLSLVLIEKDCHQLRFQKNDPHKCPYVDVGRQWAKGDTASVRSFVTFFFWKASLTTKWYILHVTKFIMPCWNGQFWLKVFS